MAPPYYHCRCCSDPCIWCLGRRHKGIYLSVKSRRILWGRLTKALLFSRQTRRTLAPFSNGPSLCTRIQQSHSPAMQTAGSISHQVPAGFASFNTLQLLLGSYWGTGFCEPKAMLSDALIRSLAKQLRLATCLEKNVLFLKLRLSGMVLTSMP